MEMHTFELFISENFLFNSFDFVFLDYKAPVKEYFILEYVVFDHRILNHILEIMSLGYCFVTGLRLVEVCERFEYLKLDHM